MRKSDLVAPLERFGKEGASWIWLLRCWQRLQHSFRRQRLQLWLDVTLYLGCIHTQRNAAHAPDWVKSLQQQRYHACCDVCRAQDLRTRLAPRFRLEKSCLTAICGVAKVMCLSKRCLGVAADKGVLSEVLRRWGVLYLHSERRLRHASQPLPR